MRNNINGAVWVEKNRKRVHTFIPNFIPNLILRILHNIFEINQHL